MSNSGPFKIKDYLPDFRYTSVPSLRHGVENCGDCEPGENCTDCSSFEYYDADEVNEHIQELESAYTEKLQSLIEEANRLAEHTDELYEELEKKKDEEISDLNDTITGLNKDVVEFEKEISLMDAVIGGYEKCGVYNSFVENENGEIVYDAEKKNPIILYGYADPRFGHSSPFFLDAQTNREELSPGSPLCFYKAIITILTAEVMRHRLQKFTSFHEMTDYVLGFVVPEFSSLTDMTPEDELEHRTRVINMALSVHPRMLEDVNNSHLFCSEIQNAKSLYSGARITGSPFVAGSY